MTLVERAEWLIPKMGKSLGQTITNFRLVNDIAHQDFQTSQDGFSARRLVSFKDL